MTGKGSWDLKIDRAQHHLEEIKAEMARYAGRYPYLPTHVRQPKGKRDVWIYRLEMTEQPDPMIAVIIGEFVHNLRSALDHIAVAMAPRNRRRSAGFPLENTDPTLDSGRQEGFHSRLKGIPPDAVALIMEHQPYGYERPELTNGGILNSLENADKHRGLIAVGAGIRDPRTTVTAPCEVVQQGFHGLREDGAEIARFRCLASPQPRESEVQVQVRGTAVITIKVADIEQAFWLPQTLEVLLDWMRDDIVPAFTPFVRDA